MIVRVFLCHALWSIFCRTFGMQIVYPVLKNYFRSIKIFYKSNFGIFLSVYLVSFWLASQGNSSLIPLVKLTQYLLIYTFYVYTKGAELTFFRNLSLSPTVLFALLFVVDTITSITLLFIQNSYL